MRDGLRYPCCAVQFGYFEVAHGGPLPGPQWNCADADLRTHRNGVNKSATPDAHFQGPKIFSPDVSQFLSKLHFYKCRSEIPEKGGNVKLSLLISITATMVLAALAAPLRLAAQDDWDCKRAKIVTFDAPGAGTRPHPRDLGLCHQPGGGDHGIHP
jgi:hypothetical protein